MEGAFLIGLIDAAARETTLFAAIWFLVGGLDDLAVDLLYLARRARLRLKRAVPESPEEAAEAVPGGRIIVFVPAWDESAVIGQMLHTTLARFGGGDYRIYVGTYPNDPATIGAVAEIAESDSRVRLVIGAAPGPTTKAACLNTLWRALVRDEVAEGAATLGVVLHDAEDLVHPRELAVYARELRRFDAVQLPVLPLRHPHSRFVSGHYCDEFAEAHAKQLLVRQALGAGLPLAGVGCAIRRDMLERIARRRGGAPFDSASLTEDYELGLTIQAMGGRTALVREPERPGGPPVAVRAYFPASFDAAVRQKARWMTGIALAGWDRVGWSAPREFGDHWMRIRDRRATLSMPVLAIAYCAVLMWGVSVATHGLAGSAVPGASVAIQWLIAANLTLLGWRLAMRAAFVRRAYGWREAAWSLPRVFVGNFVALLAARRAAFLYVRMLTGGVPLWDKTDHQFPGAAERAKA
jgi:adsorption protein B